MTTVEVPYSIAAALPSLSVMDITNDVTREVAESDVSSGIVYIHTSSTLSLVRVQERETGFFEDLESLLERVVPGSQRSRERLLGSLAGLRLRGIESDGIVGDGHPLLAIEDALRPLGVRIDIPADAIAACIDEVGFGFLFAPAHHPAMRHAGPVRRALGVRTVFNVLGPLTNPAGARALMLGVYSPELTRTLAEALVQLGVERAYVVHGAGGIYELSPCGPNLVCEVDNGTVREYELDPLELGVERCDPAELRGGDPATNAQALRGCSRKAACAPANLTTLGRVGRWDRASVAKPAPVGVRTQRAGDLFSANGMRTGVVGRRTAPRKTRTCDVRERAGARSVSAKVRYRGGAGRPGFPTGQIADSN